MRLRARAGIFYLLWTSFTLVLGLAALLLLPSRRACAAVAALWSFGALLLLRLCVGIRLRYEGEIPQGAAVFACKHQSTLETLALWLYLRNPAFILKKQLLTIPIFGWFLARLQPVAIDRSAGASAIEQVAAQGKERLEQGRRLVIFPEGTRRPVGAPAAYKAGGVWALYQLGYPLVPVALDTGRFWPKKGIVQGGTASIRFLSPLEGGLDKNAFMQQLEAAIEGGIKASAGD